MAEKITLNDLKVEDDGTLAIILSTTPSTDWQQSFDQYWHNPSQYSSGFRKSVLRGFDGNRILLVKTTVEDFKQNLRGVAEDAARYANERVVQLEAEYAQRERAAQEEEMRRRQEIAEERRRASEVKFGG